jgi:uncharacterized protein
MIGVTETNPAPVDAGERVEALDVVRGFALLGILLMNICSFGMPMAAESNPQAWGGATGANYWLWWVQYVFWSGKMRALFSICFGAGVIYLTTRAEAKGATAGDVYYRRTFWLMLFGMIHAYLIWYGDILYPYALMGLVLYPLRQLSPRVLAGAGLLMLAALIAHSVHYNYETREKREKTKTFPAHAKLDSTNQSLLSEIVGAKENWLPSKEKLDAEIKTYRTGSYFEAVGHRAGIVQGWTAQTYYSPGWWDALGMMLIGMALAKRGVFSGVWTTGRYAAFSALGIAAGAAVGAVAANHEAASGFDAFAASEGYAAYQGVRLLLAFGYLCGLIAVVKAGLFAALTGALGAVGRMAFSNYILHSLICTAVFYSYGLAQFGKWERYQLYYLVAAIWIFQLIASPIWLRHFRFGPLEWCWRSLTYWQRQPMRIAERMEHAV